MGSSKSDLSRSTLIYPQPVDHFDNLPDPVLLLVLNKIGDVKTLGKCCAVCTRFHSLVPQVDNVVVRVDCVISEDNDNNNDHHSIGSGSGSGHKSSLHPISSLFRLLIKPFLSLTQFINLSRNRCNDASILDDEDDLDHFEKNCVTHHSPTQVLKNFDEIKVLRIELPSGELGIDEVGLLKWRADFGSTLDNCVILGASSVINRTNLVYEQCGNGGGSNNNNDIGVISQVGSGESNCSNGDGEMDNGSIPESFYTNGGLKLRVVWTISSLIAASARHYLLQPIISEHKKLESLVLTDVDGQGVLCMDKEQLEELRVKPLSASSASKRTMVPALNMRLWYAPHLELPDGTVLKGATLVAIRPSEQQPNKKEVVGGDGNWVGEPFKEPYGTAVRMLVKRRTYCLEMNSF